MGTKKSDFTGSTTIDDTATTGDTLGSFLAITVNVLKVVRTRLIGGAG